MSNPLMASIHLIRAADPPTNKPNVQVGRRTRQLRYLGAYGLSRGVGRLNMLVTRCNGVKLCVPSRVIMYPKGAILSSVPERF